MERLKLPVPEKNSRVETGVIQFGDDWPGVFIRGDHAGHYAFLLEVILEQPQMADEQITRMSLSKLCELLKSSNVVRHNDLSHDSINQKETSSIEKFDMKAEDCEKTWGESIDKAFLEKVKAYIEEMEVAYDCEFEEARTLEQLLNDGDMPSLYHEVTRLLNVGKNPYWFHD